MSENLKKAFEKVVIPGNAPRLLAAVELKKIYREPSPCSE